MKHFIMFFLLYWILSGLVGNVSAGICSSSSLPTSSGGSVNYCFGGETDTSGNCYEKIQLNGTNIKSVESVDSGCPTGITTTNNEGAFAEASIGDACDASTLGYITSANTDVSISAGQYYCYQARMGNGSSNFYAYIYINNDNTGEIAAFEMATVSGQAFTVANQAVTSPGVIRFDPSTYRIGENTLTGLRIGLTRVGGSDGVLTVRLTTQDETTVQFQDYTPIKHWLTWQDGDDKPKIVTIGLINDGIREGDERFTILMEGNAVDPDNALATVVITSEDAQDDPNEVSRPVPAEGVQETGDIPSNPDEILNSSNTPVDTDTSDPDQQANDDDTDDSDDDVTVSPATCEIQDRTVLSGDCDFKQYALVSDFSINAEASLSNTIVPALYTVTGEGILRDSTILGTVERVQLDGNIELQEQNGQAGNVTFIGQLLNGNQIGQLYGYVQHAANDGVVRDVRLDANTYLVGTVDNAVLAGVIVGHPSGSSHIENVSLAQDSIIECVQMGDNVLGIAGATVVPCAGESYSIDGHAINKQGKSESHSTEFAGGSRVGVGNSKFLLQLDGYLSDTIQVQGRMRVGQAHIGQQADLIVYIVYRAASDLALQYYMFTPLGFEVWNGELAALVAYQQQALQRLHIFDIYQGKLPLGTYNCYFGYRLADGVMVLTNTDEPIHITVATDPVTSTPTTVLGTDLPDLGTGITYYNGQTTANNSVFKGGTAVTGQVNYNRLASRPTGIYAQIRGYLEVDPQHQGKMADMVVYIEYQLGEAKATYMLNSNGVPQVLDDGDLSQLVAFQENVLLSFSHDLILFSGKLEFQGNLKVFYGYRLVEEGALILNSQPIELNLL